MVNYASTRYLVARNFTQPPTVLTAAVATVPALNTDGLNVTSLNRGTLAPLGLIYDVTLSTTDGVDGTEPVKRNVTVRTRKGLFLNGNDLWQTALGSQGLAYATQNLFVGELSMTLNSAISAGGVSTF